MIVNDNEPAKIENVKILKWGKEAYRDSERIYEKKEETELPYDAVHLTRGFQQLETSGKAENFRKTDDGIICDLVIQDGYFKTMLNEYKQVTAAPKFEGEPDEDGEFLKDARLESVSLIVNHAQPELNGNVSEAHNE